MKKTDYFVIAILLLSILGTIYYGYQIYNISFEQEDPREKEYLSMEIKRNQLSHAFRYAKERQYEETVLILDQINVKDNPLGLYLKGYVFYKMNKKEEGLSLIKEALQRSNTLYDIHYPNNVRNELEEILTEISKDERLNSYRHFIESKLKGGCG